MKKDQTIVVIGPTASGKSHYSIDLAKKNNGEIISADAFQVYIDFNIGTGKIPPEEMNGSPHHLIGTQHPSEPYSVQEFIDNVAKLTTEIINRQAVPIICGGSAMYLNALINGYQPLQRLPIDKRPEGSEDELWQQLQNIDPELAQKTPKQNKARVQRYLELYRIYGQKPSLLFKQAPSNAKNYNIYGISIEKDTLKDKINKRVDHMISIGLIDEVHTLMKKYNHNSPAFKAIGYKEVVQFIHKEISKETMTEKIKQNTQKYAKRQMTWFKRFDNVQWTN
jgi:tRNA dimethylallyltransferase